MAENPKEVDVEAGVARPAAGMKRQTSVLGGGPSSQVSLAFRDIVYSVTLKGGVEKQILKGCTGAVAPGEVLAIMGPSGSGKTSLLDVIAYRIRGGKKSRHSGEILFNGKTLSTRARRSVMSYVAQEDTLMGIFTVRETLWFAARFYYGYKHKTYAQIEEQIEHLIDAVGLRVCADTIVGNIFQKGLSGGQMKRLSIAVELISSPSIVLLDEPTSGLDSTSAYAIMKELGTLSGRGHTIIATIHQPSSEIWSLFDQFMLLGAGNCVYYGDAKKCVDYFAKIGYECPKNFNPADHVINLVTTDFDLGLFKRPESIQELVDAYAKSDMKAIAAERAKSGASLQKMTPTTALALDGASVQPGNSLQKTTTEALDEKEEKHVSWYARHCIAGNGYAGFGSSFVALLYRNMLNLVRNPGIILIREAMYLMLALFLGLTFLYQGKNYDDASIIARNSLLFFVAAFFVFMSVAVLPFIIEERAVFLREKRNGAYLVLPYVLAASVAVLPGTFLIAITTSLFIVFMISLNNFGWYVFILWMSLVFAETFQLFVAAISPHYIIGIAGAAGFFGLCMIVEGFFIIFTEIGWYIRWLGYITPHRYSFRAFMRNEYQSIQNLTSPGFASGPALLQFYFPDTFITTVGGDVGVLALFALSYVFLFYLVCEYYYK